MFVSRAALTCLGHIPGSMGDEEKVEEGGGCGKQRGHIKREAIDHCHAYTHLFFGIGPNGADSRIPMLNKV